MSSLHVNLTLGHNASMPHLPSSLDPQMRVFYQRNLDPFDSSLSMTDLLHAAGNLLGLVRSSLSWAGQHFPGHAFPKPGSARPKDRKENGRGEKKDEEEGGRRREPPPASGSEPESANPPAGAKDSTNEERVRRTRETSRRTSAEAQERFRRAGKAKPTEKPAAFAELPRHYGLRLALELSLRRSPRSEDSGKEGERASRGEPGAAGSAKQALPAISFRGSLSLHLPLARPPASGSSRREGTGIGRA
ncbi:MAG: hypothetical protein PHO89_02105 [Methylacidiphilaceae bacterium]|nr:hypothetical protein [Candidatus Methylacidiphilaceae bacterium]